MEERFGYNRQFSFTQVDALLRENDIAQAIIELTAIRDSAFNDAAFEKAAYYLQVVNSL